MKIRTHFTNEGVDPVSPAESRRFRDAMFGKAAAAADSVAEGYVSSYAELDAFKNSLNRNLGKFTFGKHPIEEWKRRYCFPDGRSIATQLRSLGIAEEDLELAKRQVINLDHTSIVNWAKRHLIDEPSEEIERGAGSVVYIQGTVGSGKSSLNKYIPTMMDEEFRTNAVIPSRIECRKLVLHMQSYLDPSSLEDWQIAEQLQRFIKLSIVRDIIHYSRSAMCQIGPVTRLVPSPQDDRFPGVDGPEFENFVRDMLKDCNLDATPAHAFAVSASRAFDVVGREQPSRRGRIARQTLRKLDPFVLDAVIAWYRHHGVRFCLMLDGFDYIEAVDFYSDKSIQARLIEAVASWIAEGECRVSIQCWTVEPNVSLTIRRNTRFVIGRKHNPIFSATRSRSAYVLSPSMGQLFRTLAQDVTRTATIEGRTHSPKVIIKVIDRVRKTLKKELDLTGGISVASLFNGNVRHQLNYTRDVIYEIAATTLRYCPQPVNPYLLVAYIDFEVANFLTQKGYRLVDLLLYSAGHRFANFVSVKRENHDETDVDRGDVVPSHQDLEDNNIDSGYVGNVLNYHLSYSRPEDLAFMLEKVRILELLKNRGLTDRLRAERGEADEGWLRDRFERNAWPISPRFRLSICLLIREGMIEVVESAREERYAILPLGVVVVERLLTKLVYIENVYFGTLIPEWMHSVSDDIERNQGVTRWASSSLFHSWLLLRAIRHAEDIGVGDRTPVAKFVYERMRSGVQKSVEAMSNADVEKFQPAAGSERPTNIANARIEAYRRTVLGVRGNNDNKRREGPPDAS